MRAPTPLKLMLVITAVVAAQLWLVGHQGLAVAPDHIEDCTTCLVGDLPTGPAAAAADAVVAAPRIWDRPVPVQRAPQGPALRPSARGPPLTV